MSSSFAFGVFMFEKAAGFLGDGATRGRAMLTLTGSAERDVKGPDAGIPHFFPWGRKLALALPPRMNGFSGGAFWASPLSGSPPEGILTGKADPGPIGAGASTASTLGSLGWERDKGGVSPLSSLKSGRVEMETSLLGPGRGLGAKVPSLPGSPPAGSRDQLQQQEPGSARAWGSQWRWRRRRGDRKQHSRLTWEAQPQKRERRRREKQQGEERLPTTRVL